MPIRPDYGANRLRRRPPATRFVPRGSSQRAGRDCLNGSGPVKDAQAAHGAKTSSYDLKRNMRVRYITLKSADVRENGEDRLRRWLPGRPLLRASDEAAGPGTRHQRL